MQDIRDRCNGSLNISRVTEQWEVRGGMSLPGSPPPEIIRAMRGGSDVCVALLGVECDRRYP